MHQSVLEGPLGCVSLCVISPHILPLNLLWLDLKNLIHSQDPMPCDLSGPCFFLIKIFIKHFWCRQQINTREPNNVAATAVAITIYETKLRGHE